MARFRFLGINSMAELGILLRSKGAGNKFLDSTGSLIEDDFEDPGRPQ
jgi:hypothetical protein